eukprot:8821643-Pyramimonas_sp.AAC.2
MALVFFTFSRVPRLHSASTLDRYLHTFPLGVASLDLTRRPPRPLFAPPPPARATVRGGDLA